MSDMGMGTANQFHRFIIDNAGTRTRVDQELLWRALHAVHPELTITTAAREELRNLLDQLVLNGHVETPKGRTGWDQSSVPILPKWIRLPRQEPQSETLDLKGIPWAPELRFLSSVRTDIPVNELLEFQRFFAEGGRNLPIVPIKERSLQIFGNEKRLDALYANSVIFSTGRLTLDDLRCCVVPEPLGWKRGPAPNGPFIIIENVATWHTYCRWNEHVQHFSAVIYGGGNRFLDSLVFLDEICKEVGGVRPILYFGDLDETGLSIPQRASHKAVSLGLPRIEPHLISYKWLLESGTPKACLTNLDKTVNREVCHWLDNLADEALSILSTGKRIAQEYIGWEFLQGQLPKMTIIR